MLAMYIYMCSFASVRFRERCIVSIDVRASSVWSDVWVRWSLVPRKSAILLYIYIAVGGGVKISLEFACGLSFQDKRSFLCESLVPREREILLYI